MAEKSSSGEHVDASPPAAGGDTGSTGAGTTAEPREEELVDDPELEMLLDSSLSEFGKHLPPSPKVSASHPKQSQSADAHNRLQAAAKDEEKRTEETSLMEEAFAEELAAQTESEISQTLHKLITDPELLQQCEKFAKTLGLGTDVSGGATDGAKSNAKSKEEGEGEAGDGLAGASGQSFEDALEETVRNLQQTAQQLEMEGGGHFPDLSEMLGGLPLDGEGGEGEELVKVMEGMMSSLLSRDILYPSIDDLCKQYPDWLESHKDSVSQEDYTRYSKQLEVMRKIIAEFDRDSGGGEGARGGSNQEQQQKILQLMQQLQEYGQPPEDLAGSALPQGVPKLPTSPDACPVQ